MLRFSASIAFSVTILVMIDIIAVFVALPTVLRPNLLSNILFVEGGSFLAIGGVLEMLSSIHVSKIREKFFHQAPWTDESYIDAQSKAAKAILIGIMLILLAVVVPL